ncbi:hypothetical protein [Longimicrobium terrae]|uniref:VIT domain-containing protein n=1 Tax=Longimicrobium terrae TaxID=1639882 RepID=A0A841GWP1_9BACT|nr:hypothetical protein [Longimicrobium terrae]MBB4634324.1 hypothetical protein [Longimicrobium terrae]MBB6068786.1 hypothetical protein [Longimicrobium terrae]NNC27970.1 hypothetical protein [Longimicrobium terrae]
MRIPFLLVSLALAAAPVAAQGVLISAGCERACPGGRSAPARVPIDSVRVFATLRDTLAQTSVDHVFRNVAGEMLGADLFVPLPADATVLHVSVFDGVRTVQYDEFSAPEASRHRLDSLARARPGLRLPGYRGMTLIHVPVAPIPAGGERRVQVRYHQPLAPRGGVMAYRFPLAAGGGRAPYGTLRMVLDVRTLAGFDDLAVLSHPASVSWGSEMARCPPTHACGYRGVPSTRVQIVRLDGGPETQARDLELRYTPSAAGPDSPAAWPE